MTRQSPRTWSISVWWRESVAKHGYHDEARETLANIYGWFTEGFDTADLNDAKALC
jgi:hypothetical protein